MTIDKTRKEWRFTPAQRRVLCHWTSTEQVQVNAPVLFRRLVSARLCLFVERPVPCFPVVDTSTFELRQDVEHRLPCRCHECRPKRQLDCTQLGSFPYVARRVHDKISAIPAIYKYELR